MLQLEHNIDVGEKYVHVSGSCLAFVVYNGYSNVHSFRYESSLPLFVPGWFLFLSFVRHDFAGVLFRVGFFLSSGSLTKKFIIAKQALLGIINEFGGEYTLQYEKLPMWHFVDKDTHAVLRDAGFVDVTDKAEMAERVAENEPFIVRLDGPPGDVAKATKNIVEGPFVHLVCGIAGELKTLPAQCPFPAARSVVVAADSDHYVPTNSYEFASDVTFTTNNTDQHVWVDITEFWKRRQNPINRLTIIDVSVVATDMVSDPEFLQSVTVREMTSSVPS